MRKIFLKEQAREYSLFRVQTLSQSMTLELQKILGISLEDACVVYRGGDLVDIYYEPATLKKLFETLKQQSLDEKSMMLKIEDFLSNFDGLKKYYTKEKVITNIEEFKKFQNRYATHLSYSGIIFIVPTLPVSENLKKLAFDARSKTQEYSEAPELVFKEFIESKFPAIKNKSRFILLDEIWNGEIESQDILMKIKDREKGFVFYKNEILTGKLNDNLEKLGIILEDKKSMISGKAQVSGNEIKGQSASEGKAEGHVKIVSSVKDLTKVNRGDILVAAMTMPKYLPAMNKASAFVTDEGGITCHAAIIAREMKKPCVIGTKVATQVLKDGEFVEVDADKGVVRILK